MREICSFGSTSGDWKRETWRGLRHRRAGNRRRTTATPRATDLPRQSSTLPYSYISPIDTVNVKHMRAAYHGAGSQVRQAGGVFGEKCDVEPDPAACRAVLITRALESASRK